MTDTPAPSTFGQGLLASLPIVLGYFPIAFSFGIGATKIGLSSAEAIFLSTVMYSGAAQFLALSLIAGGAPILISAVTLIAMGLRHLLYAPALLSRAGAKAPRRFALAWSYGLTDEVFGAAIGQLARGRVFSEPFMLGLGLGAYSAWVSGTAVGALLGGSGLAQWPALSAALGFLLPALFLSLLLSILSRAQLVTIATAIFVTVLLTFLISGTVGLLAGMIAGALAGTFGGRQSKDAI